MRSHHIKVNITILVSLLTFNAYGQSVKKEISDFKQLKRLTIDSIRTGNHAGLAKELSIEDFMNYYVEHGKVQQSKKWGMYGTTIDSAYSDDIYTYYVRRSQNYLIDLFKIKTADISGIDIASIDGNLIRQKFIAEIVPQRDKERVRRKDNGTMGTESADFDYSYNKQTRLVEVNYRWKVTSDFIRVIKKTYKAYYDIDTQQFQG